MLLVLMGVGIVWAWLFKVLQPANTQATESVQFVVPKGQSVQKIGDRLEEQQLIKSAWAFRYLVWRRQLTTKIQAGSFKLSASQSPREIVQKLTTGTDDVWVTIPEGKRKEEIAAYFSEFSEFDLKEFLTLSAEDEGYLFPDTYLFPVQATAKTVHDQLRKNFDKVVQANGLEKKFQKNNTNLNDVVILASLLEREAKSQEDMKIVAGILNNRLDNGMALQVDATMQYAKGYDTKTKQWWTPSLSADKEIDSPFNTYKVTGLPPAPISNPGLKALQAAADPTPSNNLFYISDGQGKMHYSETYDQHLQNIQKYLK